RAGRARGGPGARGGCVRSLRSRADATGRRPGLRHPAWDAADGCGWKPWSAAFRVVRVGEEVVLHRGRLVADGADAMQEARQAQRVLRRHLELHFWVADDLQQEVAVDLRAGD